MIAEKLPLKFDIDRIVAYFNETVKPLDCVWQGKGGFGGWSLLSANGDYRDGFQPGALYFVTDPVTKKVTFDYERANRETGFRWPREHINFTQAGTGYMVEVIEAIRALKLGPRRARWTIISPGGATSWHRDGAEQQYAVRLHIPVITNEGATFSTDEGAYHMPADGSCYLVGVNKMHKAVNEGTEDRIHIIMDVFDETGLSQHHTMAQHLEKYPA
jgi:hypothetical protein